MCDNCLTPGVTPGVDIYPGPETFFHFFYVIACHSSEKYFVSVQYSFRECCEGGLRGWIEKVGGLRRWVKWVY